MSRHVPVPPWPDHEGSPAQAGIVPLALALARYRARRAFKSNLQNEAGLPSLRPLPPARKKSPPVEPGKPLRERKSLP